MVKNLPANARDTELIPGSGRSPGGGNSNPLQDSCLENSMDRGTWWATVHGVTKSCYKDGDNCSDQRPIRPVSLVCERFRLGTSSCWDTRGKNATLCVRVRTSAPGFCQE